MMTLQVSAINVDGIVGKIIEKTLMAPAGIPQNYIEQNEDVITLVGKGGQTFFIIDVVRKFFEQDDVGVIRATGLIGCKQDKCDIGDSMELSTFRSMQSWQMSSTAGFPPFRFTDDDWLERRSSRRRRRSESSTVRFIVGSEDCDDVPNDVYCNGPLEPGSQFMVTAVACTSGGCLLSKLYGPFETLKDYRYKCPSDSSAVIVGVVLGLVIILLAGYIVVMTVRQRRSQESKDPNETAPQAQQPYYMNQTFDNALAHGGDADVKQRPEAEYTSLNEESRESRSMYDLLRR